MKNSINEAVDLLQRRTRSYVYEDSVSTIYATMSSNYTTFYFVLDRNVDGVERMRMEQRYRRIFEDVHDRYKVQMLNMDNHFVKDEDTFILYMRGEGYSVPMERKNTNRNF